MKERGILMSAPMVRQILAGTKTQTRRIVKTREPLGFVGGRGDEGDPSCWGWAFDGPGHHGWMVLARDLDEAHDHGHTSIPSPYGEPGDRLWVREAWRAPKNLDDKSPAQIGASAVEAGYPSPWSPIQYEADQTRDNWDRNGAIWPAQAGRYRHPRFMPRWASRIDLDLLTVRVERVQDISDEDIMSEGVTVPIVAAMTGVDWIKIPTLHTAWRLGWTHINGAASWDANPWTWALGFKRIERAAEAA